MLSRSIRLGYVGEIRLLRSFRDNVLNKTPKGRDYIQLYHQWSPLIVKALKEDRKFAQKMKEMIDEVLTLIGKDK